MTTKTLADYWWLVVFRGFLGLLFGLALIAVPVKAITFLVVVLGLYLLIDGSVHALMGIFSIKKNKDWWVLLLVGIISAIIGVAILNWPQVTVEILLFLVGVWALFMGLMFVVMAILMRKESYGGWLMAGVGILSLLFGLLLFGRTAQTVQLLTLVIGLFTFVSGIMTIAFGMELRSMKKDVEKVVKVLEGK